MNENIKEEQRKKLIRLLSNNICGCQEVNCELKDSDACEYCPETDMSIGSIADNLFENGFEFKSTAEYKYVISNNISYYVCTNCNNLPLPISLGAWHFSSHCCHCGAEMLNAEKMAEEQKKRAEKMFGEVNVSEM